MPHFIRHIAWLILLTNISGFVFSQQPDKNLIEVRNVFKKHLLTGMEGKKAGHCRTVMTMTYCNRDSMHIPKTVSRVEMAVDPGKFRMTSDQIVVYRDDEFTATILPGKKMIYYSQSLPLKQTGNEQEKYEMLLDSLLGYCKVTSMQEKMTARGSRVTTAVLVPLPLAIQKSGIRSMMLVYDPACEDLKMMRTDYVSSNEMAYSIVEYNEMDTRPRKPALAQPVKNMVFTGSQLRKEFTGYTLVDLRKK